MPICNITPLPEYDPLTGCDGKPHSCQFLQTMLEDAIIEENYELCARIKREQDRRKKEGITIVFDPDVVIFWADTRPPDWFILPPEAI